MTTIAEISGGPAPFIVASLEISGDGCVRYERFKVERCSCDISEVEQLLGASTIDRIVSAMRIAPRTVSDMPVLALRHANVDAGVAFVDLPRDVQDWLAALDAAMLLEFGDAYEPFARGVPASEK